MIRREDSDMEQAEHPRRAIDRRSFLSLGFGAFCALGSGAAFARTRSPVRTLALDNVHTGEALRATYWESGRYLPDALGEIDRILRDFRTDQTIAIDTRLLDLLHSMKSVVGSSRPYEVISGYRSPATNAALLEEGHEVAAASFHTVGMAIDIRLPDRSSAVIRRVAMRLGRGGVGYYPHSGFVHVDVGPVRHW